MAKLKGIKVDLNEVSQTIDVSEVLGVDVSSRPRIVQEFGQAIIDKIIERTEDGKDVNGRKLKKYKDAYIESEDFKEFDKSPNEINMTLKGDMLNSIDIDEQRGSTVKIAVGEGVNTKKAFNHITADTMPYKREFFGVNAKELNEIKAEFSTEVDEIKRGAVSTERLDREELDLGTVLFAERQSSQDIFNDIFGDQFDG